MIMLAAAWVLYVWFAADWDRKHLTFISSNNGLRIARVLYGLCLIFFGVAHFIDVKDTVSLVPHWLPSHLFWAYFTGCAFIAAGLATLIGFCARLAVTLSAFQIALFLFLVWVPIVATGSKDPFQWSETFLNVALLAGAWVMTDSYRTRRGSPPITDSMVLPQDSATHREHRSPVLANDRPLAHGEGPHFLGLTSG